MPTVPVRNLGGAGIVSDIHPYDLPHNVFSAGVNVRFENGTVKRGPVPRGVFDFSSLDPTFIPGHLFQVPSSVTGVESLVAVSASFDKAFEIVGSNATDITAELMGNIGDPNAPVTHGFLGAVTYLNRRTHVPFMRRQADATFVPMPNWDPNWRCAVLRPYKDFLVALDVRKSASEFPQMVKWSDITLYGDAPPSWDETLTTNSAGETVLNEMRGRIVDGMTLRDTFMLYGENEVWAMSFIGGNFIFDFRKRFDDVGVIAPNCVIEVDGQHYVFDRNDIIVHDGASKRSIAHGTNKDYIFNSLVRDLQHLCFVTHNPSLNEIMFCYPSQDRLTGFVNPTTGCNRAAVYNYRRQLWTFYDLPNVTAASNAVIVTGQTWDSTTPATWNNIGGTYMGDGSLNDSFLVLMSRADADLGITASRIVAFDLIEGGRLAKPVVEELLTEAFVERVGIDLDESGVQISAYKSLLKVYPQIDLSLGAGRTTLQYGANDFSAVSPVWDLEQTFDPETQHQLDVRRAGRYLAHRLRHVGSSDFSYSGFDATVKVRGKR
jgi:hypothetical protein